MGGRGSEALRWIGCRKRLTSSGVKHPPPTAALVHQMHVSCEQATGREASRPPSKAGVRSGRVVARTRTLQLHRNSAAAWGPAPTWQSAFSRSVQPSSFVASASVLSHLKATESRKRREQEEVGNELLVSQAPKGRRKREGGS